MIRKIVVKGLIGQRFEVKLSTDIPFTSIYGSNGVGKSLFLRLLYAVASDQRWLARDIRFDEVSVKVGDGYVTFAEGDLGSGAESGISVNYYEPEMIYTETFSFPSDPDNRENRIFEDVVNGLFLHKRVHSLRPLRFRTDAGHTLRYTQLSSGERRFFLLWYKIVYNPRGTLVLVDEPERSLNITVQRKLVPQFLKLNREHGWGHQLLVASHSPAIGASLVVEHFERMVHFRHHAPDYWPLRDLVKRIYREAFAAVGKKSALEYLLSVVDHVHFGDGTRDTLDEEDVREKCVGIICDMIGDDESMFPHLEYLATSDDSAGIRVRAVEHIVAHFLERGRKTVEWVIDNDCPYVVSRIEECLASIDLGPLRERLMRRIAERRRVHFRVGLSGGK